MRSSVGSPVKSIRMSDELYDELQLYCSIQKISMAEFIRDAVDEYIRKRIEDDAFRKRAEALFSKDRETLDRLLKKEKNEAE